MNAMNSNNFNFLEHSLSSWSEHSFWIARVCMAADVGKSFLQNSDKFNLNIFA